MWRSVIIKQSILVSACAALFFAFRGAESGLAALYGGATALLNVQLLSWRRRQSQDARAMDARSSLRALYRSALERFALVAVLLGTGMGLLSLQPLPLLVGFMVGQAAVLFLWTEQEQGGRS